VLYFCWKPSLRTSSQRARPWFGLVSGQERKTRPSMACLIEGKKGECFGKLKPRHQWCRYPIPNVVPETGVWIIGDGESLPFRKVFYKCPRPEAHH
jgi:hypothetical protein